MDNENQLIEMIKRYEHPSAVFPFEDNDFKIVEQHANRDGRVIIKKCDNKFQVQFIDKHEDIYCIDYNGRIILGINNNWIDVREKTVRQFANGALSKEPFISTQHEMRSFKLITIVNYYILYKHIYDK